MFTVNIEDTTSGFRPILVGVPQRSCLSLFLYIIYTNDLSTHPQAQLALFADDTMFPNENHNPRYAIISLQRQVNMAKKWFEKWRLSINLNKTVAIFFNKI